MTPWEELIEQPTAYADFEVCNALSFSYAMRFRISLSCAFVKFIFCVFMTFLNCCVAFS